MKIKIHLVLTLFLMFAAAIHAQNISKHENDTLFNLTIYYLYEINGSEAVHPYLNKLPSGEQYIITSPKVPGHHPDKETIQGVMPEHNVTDTVLYAKNKHGVTIDPTITHGTVTVSPSSEVEIDQMVTITAVPDNNYVLSIILVYKQDDENQTVPVSDYVFIMPDFDVFVTAVFVELPPVISGEIAPQTICSGETLSLTSPAVSNAIREGWEIAPNEYFQPTEEYMGQTLDASYNGWKLRFWASNGGGITYSNVVDITVNVIEPDLTGDLYLCTMQTGTYTVVGVDNATITWTVSDGAAIVTESGKTLKVTWITAGQQTVTLAAVNEETGCSAEVNLVVNVVAFINNNDVQQIVAKKDNGRDYILIYPNPKEAYKYQWYKDGEAISGANGQYYYQQGGLDAGAYKVYLSLNADAEGNLLGGVFTNEYVVVPASMSFNPNPAQSGEDLLISNTNGGETIVSVFTLDGRLLHQLTITGTNVTLNLNLTRGVYIIKMNDNKNEYNEKLIVK